MAERGDKAPLITTGSFSAEAKKEAIWDDAPPVTSLIETVPTLDSAGGPPRSQLPPR